MYWLFLIIKAMENQPRWRRIAQREFANAAEFDYSQR
jgi:hypothetical protein